MDNLLPWQQPIWDRLQRSIRQQRVPHALLLHGPAGIGKGVFAQQLAQRLLCAAPTENGFGCGACPSCKLFAAGTHSDLLTLEPEEGKSVLVVDQVREMVEVFGYTPQIASRKVVVLQPAESMNINAANSLLKTLEEPPGEAVMLLISHSPAQLLPTIRSRCQQVAFPPPTETESLVWLQQQLEAGIDARQVLLLADGAPLRALTLSDPEQLQHYQQMEQELFDLLHGRADPIRVAYRWSSKKLDPAVTLRWLQQWITLLIKGGEMSEPLAALFQRLQGVDRRRLFTLYDKVTEAVALASTPVNKELLFEGILLEWSSFR